MPDTARIMRSFERRYGKERLDTLLEASRRYHERGRRSPWPPAVPSRREYVPYCTCGQPGCAECAREYHRAYTRNYSALARDRVFDHYGRACACCGATENLTIDHIERQGAAHRRELFGKQGYGSVPFYRWLIKNNFPPGFQVLCMACNQSKGISQECVLWH
jgi:hypothetical protein